MQSDQVWCADIVAFFLKNIDHGCVQYGSRCDGRFIQLIPDAGRSASIEIWRASPLVGAQLSK